MDSRQIISEEKLAEEIEQAEAPEEQQMSVFDYLMGTIANARQLASSLPKNREMAIVVTKLDEAGLWLSTQNPAFQQQPEPELDPSAADDSDIWTPPGAGKLAVVGEPGTELPGESGPASEEGGEVA